MARFAPVCGMGLKMDPAQSWTDLLARHPVLKRAHRLGFVELEKQNLVRYLEATGLFDQGELDVLRAPGDREVGDLMALNMRVVMLLERIAQIEAGLLADQRQEMLNGAYAFLHEATGLPQESISGLFSEVQWTSAGLAEVFAGGSMTTPKRKTTPAELQKPESGWLLALLAKRITHDLVIHGKSLRYFYQALPLLREMIDRAQPGLTNLYVGFAASLQLMMLLYDGPFLEGAAVRAGRVEVEIINKAFRIRVMGINFPSVFNEIVKGLFESLLHPGMPASRQLGKDEALFRELTGGPDLEYALMKTAPEVAGRLHQILLGIANRHRGEIKSALRRAGFEAMTDAGNVSMLFRAFSQMDPRSTQIYAARAIEGPLSARTESRLMAQLLPFLEA